MSGHKVRVENRDKLRIIKEHAKQGKFDILLVFMFDRIGRIADETPFVVEWFVKNSVHVWSTQEGEQRFDNHTDKLTNYIRFWQADNESEKTSIRTKTALGQIVEDGGFKGGVAPYGYDLVRSGRLNDCCRPWDICSMILGKKTLQYARHYSYHCVKGGKFGPQIYNSSSLEMGYPAS